MRSCVSWGANILLIWVLNLLVLILDRILRSVSFGCRIINPKFFFFQPRIGGCLDTHSGFFFGEFGREPCQQPTHGVTLCGMTCIHASVYRSPRGHGSVAPNKRHYRQWINSLFCGFLPNPFIHDLFLWHTSQEFVKADLYPLSLMSLQYAVCPGAGW